MEASVLLDALRAALPDEDEAASVVLGDVYDDVVEFSTRFDSTTVWAVAYRADGDEVTIDPDELGIDTIGELRSKLNAKARNDLDNSSFAYIDSTGGRHLPVHDAAHAEDAMSRWGQTHFESDMAKTAAAKKIMSAANKFGIKADPTSAVAEAAKRSDSPMLRKGRRQRRELERSTERRELQANVELRDVDKKGNTATLIGRPIVYDAPYKVRDMFGEFTETMLRGAAANVIANPDLDCRFLFDHKGIPLGSTASGTLKLEDRADGVHSTVTLDLRQPSAMDLFVATERKDVRHMSIGFMVGSDGESWDNAQEDRQISNLSGLLDVSAVTYPASPTTSIMLARSALASMPAETRERVRRLYPIAKSIRTGDALTQADGDLLISVVTALYEADDLDEEAIAENLRSAGFLAEKPAAVDTIEIQRQRLALARARALSAQ